MTTRLRTRLPYLLSLALVAAAFSSNQQPRSTPRLPSVTILSPLPGEAVQGVAVIRFRTENVSITSPFLPAVEGGGPFPPGHLHVSVDGAPWHWIHSTSDPVVITPLPAGEHTVELELAGADHRPLDVQSVHFTVVARTAPAMDHTGHH
jgi:hypothetical protein